MIRRILQAFALALLFAATHLHAQQPNSSVAQRKLILGGATLFMPLMTDIARRFEGLYPDVRIELRLMGASDGLSGVRSGSAAIAMLPRALQDGERDLFGYPIARDGLAVIVNRDNPIKNITSKDLIGILTGRIANWKLLGGRDSPIRLAWYTGDGRGSTYFILQYLKLKREQINPHTALATNDDAIKFVASNPDGVALASVAISEQRIKTGSAVQMLAFDGMPAASRTIQNHAYPLSRPLMLVTRAVPEGRQKEFIDYSGSPRVLDLQLKYGFVPYER
ncbi:MAG TPA: substrate-binding domain-containing protein [Burkholderiales bacterium]|nr:substrate-binding domain-containing protein [Burkholderiales bacterium]